MEYKNYQEQECKSCRIGTARFSAAVSTVFFLFFSLAFPSPGLHAEDFIGGSTPSIRPADAPKIKRFVKDENYFDLSLRGVSKPYPASLMFLKDQGAWYTPFTRPGMLARYDLRGWHSTISPSHVGKDIDSDGMEDVEVSR